MNDSTTTVPSGEWVLAPDDATIELSIKNMLFRTVTARLQLADATVTIGAEPEQTIIEARIDSASFDTGSAKRDEHVKSDDFLDAVAHQHMVFRSSKVTATAGGYDVAGALTIRDASSPVTLHVRNLRPTGDATSFTATAQIDRREAGVSKMPAFMIGNTIDVSIVGTARTAT